MRATSSVVADAKLPKSQGPEHVFGRLDLPQKLRSDLRAHRKPRREAGERRFIPHGEVQETGKLAHVVFREPGLP